MSASARDLAAALRRLAATHPATAPFLALWPDEGHAATGRLPDAPRILPVVATLSALRPSGVPAADAVIDLARRLAPELAWRQTYAEPQVGRDFLDNYGWTELIGRRGVLPSETLAAGLLLLGPETLYPPHRHAAEEIYIPVSGHAVWLMEERWTRHPPNTVVYHRPHVVHATRSEAEPLLALYLWRGDGVAEAARLV